MGLNIIVMSEAAHKIVGELACHHARANRHSAKLVHSKRELHDELASAKYDIAVLTDSLGDANQEEVAEGIKRQYPELVVWAFQPGIEDPEYGKGPIDYAIPKNMHWMDKIFFDARNL